MLNMRHFSDLFTCMKRFNLYNSFARKTVLSLAFIDEETEKQKVYVTVVS